MICGLNMTSSHKAPKNPIVALLGEFGYSQNGGGTLATAPGPPSNVAHGGHVQTRRQFI